MMRRLHGRTHEVWTGIAVVRDRETRTAAECARVQFVRLTAEEIEAYVRTGEPLEVAGAFTIDGLGGAFVSGITGDPHNVVGISVPLLRLMFDELGFRWTDFWTSTGG